jgi:hypothetical protein
MFTDCKYAEVDGDKVNCKIAYELCAIKSPTTKEACDYCSTLQNSRTHNQMTVSLAIQSVKANKPDELKEFIKQVNHLISTEVVNIGEGPGTELTKILSWFAKDTPGCKCKDRAHTMNIWGVQGCKNNMDTILDWLQESAKERKIPYVRSLARSLVNLAIKRAESCIPKDAS